MIQTKTGRRPYSTPTLELGRRPRVVERGIDPVSCDYGSDPDFPRKKMSL
uniref:Uncharacterized protein n=1 Tax=Arundo donax TaxID=35708 RepID=A0A0A9CSR4_ARUDO